MKAAGPSQSWAQFLRVEYMTLKSFSPWRNNMFSSLADSSAMQPTRCSILSFLFLQGRKTHLGDLARVRDEYETAHNTVEVYFRTILSWRRFWLRFAQTNIGCMAESRTRCHWQTYAGKRIPKRNIKEQWTPDLLFVIFIIFVVMLFKKSYMLFKKLLLSLSLGQKMISGGISAC